MSWLTDLAGKAEQLLNKVDQTAAVALKHDDVNHVGISNHLKGGINPYHAGQHFQAAGAREPFPATRSGTPVGAIRDISSPPSGPVSAQRSPGRNVGERKQAMAKPKSQVDDDQLFEFLNSAKVSSTVSKPPTESLSCKTVQVENLHVTKGPRDQGYSTGLEAPGDKPQSELATDVVQPEENDVKNVALHEGDVGALQPAEETPMSSGSATEFQRFQHSQTPQSQTRLSSLEFENGVLKNEVESTNQELAKAMRRTKEIENELQHSRRSLEQYTLQQLTDEKATRELLEKEADLKQALDAKDSQLAVLRVRLQEADQELIVKRELVDRLQHDNRRILEDHTSSSGLHNQAILTVQERLQQSEDGLDRERQSFRSAQSESLQRISRLEEELKVMATNYNVVQSKLGEEKIRNNELASHLKTAKHNVESTQQELADYKVKAQRILQSKEKLIATLKESSSRKFGDGDEAGSAAASAVELEELRQERDVLKDELLQANQQSAALRMEMQELESQLQEDLDTAREQYREIEESLREERERKKDLEQELSHLKEESRYMGEDFSRQRTTLQSRIQDRDAEIEKLRKQLMSKQVNTTSQTELESRLNALTESLIQKQTTLEVLSTEKSSLVFQLERLEKQLKEQSAYARRTSSMAVNVADDNDVKLRVPGFMVETPFDGGVTRKVKRVYNTIDTLSIRLGIFLRRYPVARIFVIAYMVLLHFWVMVVLLTYSPEMHDGNDPQYKKSNLR